MVLPSKSIIVIKLVEIFDIFPVMTSKVIRMVDVDCDVLILTVHEIKFFFFFLKYDKT